LAPLLFSPNNRDGFLEGEPQLELNVAMLNRRSRRACNASAGSFASLNANGGARRKTWDCCTEVVGTAHDERVGVVKNVKRIRAEFQVIPLGDEELLVDAKVEVPGTGSAEDIPSGHVGRIRSKFRVSGDGIGELTHGRIGNRDVVKGVGSSTVRERSCPWNCGIQDQPGQLLELDVGRVEDGEWCAGVRDEDGRKSPAARNLLDYSVRIPRERNFPRSAQGNAMAQIEVGVPAIQTRIGRIE